MNTHRTALAALLSAATVIGVASPAFAQTSPTLHETADPTGAQFTCGATELTITGGTLDSTWHTTVDGRGIYHIGGTNVPHNVTMSDADGSTYGLTGTSRFTGSSTTPDPDGLIVATDVDHFVIHSSNGSVVGQVQLVVHLTPNGNFFAIDGGNCEQVETD